MCHVLLLLLSGHVFLYQNIDTIDICIVSQYIQKCSSLVWRVGIMLVTEIEISLKNRQLVLASLLLSGHVFLYQNIDTIDICIVSQYYKNVRV